MKKVCSLVAIALLSLGVAAQAAITNDTVTIGDPGNKADTTGYGKVNYTYNIGKYEVTAGQYCEFLNAVAKTDTYGLYIFYMADTRSGGCGISRSGSSGSFTYTVDVACVNRPVNYVSFWDACRFANWLNNGQGNADTEAGAYTLTRASVAANTVKRNVDWKWAITSNDEWYKAAYYKGDGLYSLYANGSDLAPSARTASNYNARNTWDGTINGAVEQNGTKDMMGNVWEWNEFISYDYNRVLRGGAFYDGGSRMQSSIAIIHASDREYDGVGFRVVQAVPEPSSIIALLGGLTGLIGLRRRKA